MTVSGIAIAGLEDIIASRASATVFPYTRKPHTRTHCSCARDRRRGMILRSLSATRSIRTHTHTHTRPADLKDRRRRPMTVINPLSHALHAHTHRTCQCGSRSTALIGDQYRSPSAFVIRTHTHTCRLVSSGSTAGDQPVVISATRCFRHTHTHLPVVGKGIDGLTVIAVCDPLVPCTHAHTHAHLPVVVSRSAGRPIDRSATV
jgi:hypothetical protein